MFIAALVIIAKMLKHLNVNQLRNGMAGVGGSGGGKMETTVLEQQ